MIPESDLVVISSFFLFSMRESCVYGRSCVRGFGFKGLGILVGVAFDGDRTAWGADGARQRGGGDLIVRFRYVIDCKLLEESFGAGSGVLVPGCDSMRLRRVSFKGFRFRGRLCV